MPRDEDDTFARTMAGIEQFRAKHDDDGTWLEWRQVVFRTVRAGRRMEETLTEIKGQLEKIERQLRDYAKSSATAALAKRMDALEDKDKEHKKLKWLLLKWLLGVGTLAITWYLGKASH